MSESMPPAPDENSGPDGQTWDFVVGHATDPYWHELTGMCGGCGRQDCHEGKCPTVPGHIGYCTTCPTRRATGEVRGAR